MVSSVSSAIRSFSDHTGDPFPHLFLIFDISSINTVFSQYVKNHKNFLLLWFLHRRDLFQKRSIYFFIGIFYILVLTLWKIKDIIFNIIINGIIRHKCRFMKTNKLLYIILQFNMIFSTI